MAYSTMVHVTHEAVGKVGGIGAVLHGFFTCNAYLKVVNRSILVSPLFTVDCPPQQRLGENGEILYSSMDGIFKTAYTQKFRQIENRYNTSLVYGRRVFTDGPTGVKSSQEVLLVDVRCVNKAPIDQFKRRLFERFRIRSNLYEHLWEYEQYVRLAPPAIEALKVIGAAGEGTIIVAHEFMGMPTALAAVLEPACQFKTMFYAHEVATVRHIVEKHPGHDTMFYNLLAKAARDGTYLADIFGPQDCFFKHVLIEASRHCDCVCAVGKNVVEELKFLGPYFETKRLNIVYNGIPAYETTLEQKLESKRKLQQYCEELLGYRPDFIFTHVARMVVSKGLWRDLRVLEKLERHFRNEGKTGVLLLVSTEVAQRPAEQIEMIESAYGWPVAHREGWPDLSEGEAALYTAIQHFNTRSRNIKAILINQFFTRGNCGRKMPADLDFIDLRRGTDVEFGQSVYEPFGISQLEPLTFGGICVVGSVCGCLGFVNDALCDDQVCNIDNIIVADYTKIDHKRFNCAGALLNVDRSIRDQIEAAEATRLATELMRRLPEDESDIEKLILNGYSLAKKMSWETVVTRYLLPSLRRIDKGDPGRIAASA